MLSAVCSCGLWLQAARAARPAATARVVVIFMIIPWLMKTAGTKRTATPIGSERVTGNAGRVSRLSRRSRGDSRAAGGRDHGAAVPGGPVPVNPRSIVAERDHRLEALAAVSRDRRPAEVVQHVEAVPDPDEKHGDRPADLVAAHGQIKVAGRHSERPQRLHLNDRPVLHVAGAMLEGLGGA